MFVPTIHAEMDAAYLNLVILSFIISLTDLLHSSVCFATSNGKR